LGECGDIFVSSANDNLIVSDYPRMSLERFSWFLLNAYPNCAVLAFARSKISQGKCLRHACRVRHYRCNPLNRPSEKFQLYALARARHHTTNVAQDWAIPSGRKCQPNHC
jgi:hypothetical protein